jgi:hypothetical protein
VLANERACARDLSPALRFAYRRRVPSSRAEVRATRTPSSAVAWSRTALAFAVAGLSALLGGCGTVDPGPNFVVTDEQFDENYFFCFVEPEFLFAKKCGPGDPAAGDPSGGCHFNASAVSGMTLVDHPPVDCGGGSRPVNRAQIGAGSPARSNFVSASLVMSRDFRSAPIYVRPRGSNHPRAIFAEDDPAVDILRTWAQRR